MIRNPSRDRRGGVRAIPLGGDVSMTEFTESDIRNLADEEVDLSGGCGHLRDIAAESGMDCDTCFTSRTLSTVNGIPEVEVYYDENGSVFSAWKAWKKGIGGSSGSSRDQAIVSFLESYADECSKKVVV